MTWEIEKTNVVTKAKFKRTLSGPVDVEASAQPSVPERDLDLVLTENDLRLSSQVLQKECLREFDRRAQEEQKRTVELLQMVEEGFRASQAREEK